MSSKYFWFYFLIYYGHGQGNQNGAALFKIFSNYFSTQSILIVSDLYGSRRKFNKSLSPKSIVVPSFNLLTRMNQLQRWTFQIYNHRIKVTLFPNEKTNKLGNCIFVVSEESLLSEELFNLEMNNLYENPLWDPTGKNIIIFGFVNTKLDHKIFVRKIIERLWKKSKAVNNLVIVFDKDFSLKFYTWIPYKQPDCSEVQTVVHLNTFEKGRFHFERDLFPSKIGKDLDGCEVIAATDECAPYVFYDEAGDISKGIEVELVRTLAKLMNFRLRVIRQNHTWKNNFNGTTSGVMRLLLDQEVDLAFSCMMLSLESYKIARALHPYSYDYLLWFVPRPIRQTHAFDVLRTFDFNMWLMIIFTFFISSLIFFLFSCKGKSPKSLCFSSIDAFFKIFRMALSTSVVIRNRRPGFRVFIFLFCIYSMHITISFQSSLLSLFKNPNLAKVISSVREAVDEEFFFYLRYSDRQLYNQTDPDLWNQILKPGNFKFIDDDDPKEAFDQISQQKKAIALYIESTGIHKAITSFSKKQGQTDILWLDKKFSSYPVTMYLSPNNPLYSLFQITIHKVLSTGIVKHWIDKTIMTGKFRQIKTYENRPLSMLHLSGAFFLIIFLWSVSTLVFLCEVFGSFGCQNKIKEMKKVM